MNALFQSLELNRFAEAVLVLACWILFVGCMAAAVALLDLFDFWRKQRRTPGRRAACDTSPKWEYSMKKRITLVAVMAVILTIIGLQTGCSTGTLGNGQIDLPVDISVEWHDNFGNGFVLENGTLTEATYRSVKTGIVYEIADDGFAITAPDGTKVRIRKKEEPGELDPADQAWLQQMRLDVAEMRRLRDIGIAAQQSSIPPLAPPG